MLQEELAVFTDLPEHIRIITPLLDKLRRGEAFTETEGLNLLNYDSPHKQLRLNPHSHQYQRLISTALDAVKPSEQLASHLTFVHDCLSNTSNLGLEINHPLEQRYIQLFIRSVKLDSLFESMDQKDGLLRDLRKQELLRRAANTIHFKKCLLDSGYFTDTYHVALRNEMPRAITGLFAEVAAEHNISLTDQLMAHAFPNYPEPTEQILNLGLNKYSSVLDSPNFKAHYEHLILRPYMDQIPRISHEYLGRLQDEDLMWKYVYRMQALHQNHIYNLAATYQPDSAFARVPLVERARLNRRSRDYLKVLFFRALKHGEVRDDILDAADSSNVVKVLLNCIKVKINDENTMQTLKETAPAVTAMALAYNS